MTGAPSFAVLNPFPRAGQRELPRSPCAYLAAAGHYAGDVNKQKGAFTAPFLFFRRFPPQTVDAAPAKMYNNYYQLSSN